MSRKKLTILIVGSGAREHALAAKLAVSSLVRTVLCAPGNAGFLPKNLRNVKETDIESLVELAQKERVDLVVVGPEVPLVNGLVDSLAQKGIAAFGPTAQMAQLEGSKVYAKMLCKENDIPTAHFFIASTLSSATEYINRFVAPPVVKANGLCGGKGVVVAKTHAEALEAAEAMLVKGIYGEAGTCIIIEERLSGPELSVMAFCDGNTVALLPLARDYKRAYEGDKGPNTGGMGAYSPLHDVDDALVELIKRKIFLPAIRGFEEEEEIPYRGLLYAGIMLTEDGPQLLEFNVRFGDPETQVILARVKSDILPYMLGTLTVGGLAKLPPLEVSADAAVCVVLASEGYPVDYKIGMWVTGSDEDYPDARVYHAGTAPDLLATKTSGGRVFSVVGTGATIEQARTAAYFAASKISYPNKYLREDIAANVS